ncbi:MAG: metallopeptidase family protein [Methylacidiphilales bacterium]|nr:metallopeptidase family protein [Candidatus Methylacidiphilales bacterium]
MNPRHWEELKAIAQKAIEATIAQFPSEIKEEAQKVPYLFEKECKDDPDLLGIYGHFVPGEVSPANGPIVLYLGTIEGYCLNEGADFAEEVRLTYLHEFGHHLGWDEGDLEERGLA